jgi:UDP-glucose 4-epimerase
MNITEFSPIIADTYYGLSKYVSERIFLLDQKHNKEKLIIIRTPTVYGFGDKINAHTPSGFLNILREGGEIELWGDGTELREFIFIDDIIYIINKLTHIDYSGILNTGSGCGYSYKEAIDIIAKVLDIEPNVTNKERTKDKIDKVVDPDNLISIIGNVPFTTLYNGIDLMIKHN